MKYLKYCKSCVQTDTRPGIYFSEDGICGACVYEEEKKTIDWDARHRELVEIAEWAKRDTKANYDCAIGVSGGKDSTFQSLYARDILGLRPLLVNCEPEGITDIGEKNIENLKRLGFDTISIRPNPNVMKKLVRRDFYTYLNPVKVTEYPLYAVTYRIAQAMKLPLIIQGENPGLTLGARNTGVGVDGDALKANKLQTLSSGWEEYMIDGITEKDLFLYHYDDEELRRDGVVGVWLNYYVREWSQPHNAEFSIAHGLTIRPQYFDPYEVGTYGAFYQLDGDLTPVNQILKYYKFGFGQCTDHACYDIRVGRLTREQGIELVKRYDGKCGIRLIKKFCDYIGITVDEFWRVVGLFVNKDLFEWDAVARQWKPKFEVGVDFEG